MNLYTIIKTEFNSNASSEIAQGQKAYMKGQYDYFGIKTPIRKEIQKPYLIKNKLPEIDDAIEIMKQCFNDEHREMQYFGMELMIKYQNKLRKEDIKWIEWMILTKSWWDTVDLTATKLAGSYFKLHPEMIEPKTKEWMKSGNMWLQRTALLFQLKYKEHTDTKLLNKLIVGLLGSKEFFINKAIGWILREYGKTNPEWVIEFVKSHENKLANLSKKEALRRLV